MAHYASSRAHLDEITQLIEQSREAVESNRALSRREKNAPLFLGQRGQ